MSLLYSQVQVGVALGLWPVTEWVVGRLLGVCALRALGLRCWSGVGE